MASAPDTLTLKTHRDQEGRRSADGKLDFGFGHIPAGEHLTFWISLQVNPTNVGHRSQRVQLYDGKRLLITVDRTITIFP